MLADDAACNARNPFPGCVYPDRGRHLDLYGDNIEVDYRGYEVTVENFLRVLTGQSVHVLAGMKLAGLLTHARTHAQAESTPPSRAPNASSQTTARTSSSS